MEIPITVPALLFPAIAILMLGYINRYVSVAGVVRSFKKDYDGGYKHAKLVMQLQTLKKRIELARLMIAMAATALLLACLSMFMIFGGWQTAGRVSFGSSLIAMILSVMVSLYETRLSNKSLVIELDDMLERETS